jgi:hypothetical protein
VFFWCVALMEVFIESKDSLSPSNELNVVPVLRISPPPLRMTVVNASGFTSLAPT